jgi:hypothetical protein
MERQDPPDEAWADAASPARLHGLSRVERRAGERAGPRAPVRDAGPGEPWESVARERKAQAEAAQARRDVQAQSPRRGAAAKGGVTARAARHARRWAAERDGLQAAAGWER